MAVAFVAAGATVHGDGGSPGASTLHVPTPAGLAANQFLIMAIGADGDAGPATPAGWHKLTGGGPGPSSTDPYYAPPRAYVFWKIATGSEGASVTVVFPQLLWPNGSPFYEAAMLSYSGTDLTNPIETWSAAATLLTNSALAHPILTTAVTGDYLLTFRWTSVNFTGTATHTISGGTNAERVDVGDGEQETAMALYDSNGTLAAGAQTQRTTTSSLAADYGSIGLSIAVRPPNTAITNATADEADSIGTAYGAMAVTNDGPWQLCDSMPAYSFAVDWSGNGTFTDPGDDVTGDILDGGVSVSYGRDQSRQLTPAKTGTESFSLNNTERTYSPENVGSVLFGDLDPARNMRGDVLFNGTSYALGRMRIDDYNVTADADNRTADFTFLDGMKGLDGTNLSTDVLQSQRTGSLINYILDQVGWTGPRDIDPGATIVGWWWLDGTDALQAVQDLVRSEGPPSIAYVALDGTFVFRDRHHRILRAASLTAQATYAQRALGDCAAPAVTGLSFTAPFSYAHGWRDIVNSVGFDAVTRAASGTLTPVWQYGTVFTLRNGQSMTITASSSDPFTGAVIPVAGTDYTLQGGGVLSISMSRTQGASVKLTLLAVGSDLVITDLQLRAKAITVVSTVRVSRSDSTSIASHGEQSYPDTAPWAGPEDAYAVAGLILLHYAKRRPTVQLRLTASDPRHLYEILNRQISDRIHITYGEMGINDDFFIETVSHTITRMNASNGRPPVHAVIFGCEKETAPAVSNPFRFDTRGSGFDQGVFDPLSGDDPSQVFVWDDPRGSFDFGVFGT
jgi:hypothetical protein